MSPYVCPSDHQVVHLKLTVLCLMDLNKPEKKENNETPNLESRWCGESVFPQSPPDINAQPSREPDWDTPSL